MTGGKTLVLSIAIATIASGAILPANAAGLFDDFARAFFSQPSAPRAVETYDPLSVTVKPRRQRQGTPGIPAAEVSSKPAPPVVKLDPATDPSWYLHDPTLRRGDIVVTRTGVLVYQGRDSDDLRGADFLALGMGKPGTKSWQQQLQAAATGGRSFFVTGAQSASAADTTAKTAAMP